jgi:hypothetical protein
LFLKTQKDYLNDEVKHFFVEFIALAEDEEEGLGVESDVALEALDLELEVLAGIDPDSQTRFCNIVNVAQPVRICKKAKQSIWTLEAFSR